jgi:hypothetical protein
MFSIAIVLLVILFPLLIPAAVTATHAITEAGQRRREQIANSLGDGVGPIGGQPISHEHTRRAAVAWRMRAHSVTGARHEWFCAAGMLALQRTLEAAVLNH